MSKQYTAKDVRLLNDRDHVRLRTQVYLGNMSATTYKLPVFTGEFKIEYVTFVPAVYKAVGEIIENSLDEFTRIGSSLSNKKLTIEADTKNGHYTITDNGRGIPIEKHPDAPDLYTPHVCLGLLRSGRNFEANKDAGVIGQNGVGSACTNYCSTEFDITVYRDNKRYIQHFTNGADKYSDPKITPNTTHETGTQISFKLDPSVFKQVSLPEQLVHNRAIEIAMTNPGVAVSYNETKYRFKDGMQDIVEQIIRGRTGASYFTFNLNTPKAKGQIHIIFNVQRNIDEQMFTWVNSTLLFDEGICNKQFFNAFFDKTIEHLSKEAAKEKAEVTRNDVRENLLVFADLKITDPEYDAQSKTRLTGPSLRDEIVSMVADQWKQFARKNEQWLANVLKAAIQRHDFEANKKAIQKHEKNIRKKVDGLLDATSKNRSACQILITEGLSAKSQISEARDPITTAAFPLTGKINNVYGCKPAEVLKMGKLTDLMAAIGLVPGRKASRSDLRYGKIVIATDADYDGDDIFTLLVNLFYQFWPELFDPNYDPIIHRLIAPNVCLVKGKERIHFPSRPQYEKDKNKYKGYEVRYYKGLGSMHKDDWEMILTGKTDTFIPIVDDSKMKDTLELLFGSDADARKQWLTTRSES